MDRYPQQGCCCGLRVLTAEVLRSQHDSSHHDTLDRAIETKEREPSDLSKQLKYNAMCDDIHQVSPVGWHPVHSQLNRLPQGEDSFCGHQPDALTFQGGLGGTFCRAHGRGGIWFELMRPAKVCEALIGYLGHGQEASRQQPGGRHQVGQGWQPAPPPRPCRGC